MKTKHLLFAAALPLAFAACQNEEFESANPTELSKDQRPLVEVSLNFQKGGADTRVSYDGANYGWTTDDQIGAFLMDEIASNNRPFGSTADAWTKETWLEHYKLVSYIHTDYPFSWNADAKEWQAPSKLQEGNYFFACPYETYEGNRQLIHNLDSQMQNGGTEAAMNTAISKNQYFIGYSQVKAGSGNKEALKSVVMTPTLAPIKVTLKNIGTEAKDIEKVIVYGDQVATAVTVNPTEATYGGTDTDGKIKNGKVYNLGTSSASVGSTDVFNYANVIDATEDVHTVASKTLVYNVASGATDYNKGDALRQIVKPSYSVADPNQAPVIEKQAILTFASPVNIASKGEINFAVMVNTIPEVTTNKLMMDIITTQGQITTIDLTEKKEAETDNSGQLKPNTVLTNIGITSLKPGVKNEMIIQFDDNSVVKTQDMNVQDEAQLMAFIKWNTANARVNKATLIKDVKFTKAMYDAVKASSYKGTLAIAGTEGKLLVDNDVPADVLDVLDATSTATIVLNGERAISKNLADALKEAKMVIENQGVLTIAEEVIAYVELNNYGTIKVTEDGKLKGQSSNDKVYNYGMLENLGEIYNVNNSVKDDAKGWIKTSAKVNHIATNVTGATIQLTAVSNPLAFVNANAGTIYLETATGVKASELNAKKVTKLNVTGGIINFDNVNNDIVTELTINGTVKVEGWNNAVKPVSTYHKFNAVTTATIDGTVTFTNAGIEGQSKTTVNKGAALTFGEGEAKFKDITFIKGATVSVVDGGRVKVDNVVWNNNTLNNLGTFYYDTASTGTVNTVAGNAPVKTPTNPPVQPTNTVKLNVEINSGSAATTNAPTGDGTLTVANLEDLDKFMNNEAGSGLAWPTNTEYVIKDITIASVLELKDDTEEANDYNYLKAWATGKEVKLSANLTGLTNEMGLSFSKLTVTGAATVSGYNNQPNVTILTVTNLDYTAAKLTITDGYIQINGSAQAGDGSTFIKGTSTNIAGTGLIVTTDKLDSKKLVKWNGTTSKWADL